MAVYQGGKNPFLSDQDDEFSFGGSSRSGSRGFDKDFGERTYNGNQGIMSREDDDPFRSSSSTSFEEPMSRYDQAQQQKQQSMNRQLDATNRCLASIYDSERVGVATAEELLAQGEQLDNVERKLDKILVDTKTSQRHLNGIKSIFGGIKNWWTGDGKKEAAPPPPVAKKQSATLQQAMTSDRDLGVHPAMRLRSGDVKGFYDDDVVEFSPNDTTGFQSQKAASFSTSRQADVPAPAEASGFQSEKPSTRSAEWKEYEENLNKNLDLMSGGMSRLKMLAVGLGEEIEAQNEQIDTRIMDKADRADTKIRDQNRQMRQILKK